MKYRSGKTNIADCLSRLTQIKTEKSRISRVVEDYIMFMTVNAVPGALTAHDIEEASVKDTEIRNLHHAIWDNNWDEAPEYKHVRSELSVLGKLVIPLSLRKTVLDIGHEGHQGIVKTKAKLRESVWWPGIDRDAERIVRKCHACKPTVKTRTYVKDKTT